MSILPLKLVFSMGYGRRGQLPGSYAEISPLGARAEIEAAASMRLRSGSQDNLISGFRKANVERLVNHLEPFASLIPRRNLTGTRDINIFITRRYRTIGIFLQ